MTSRYPPRRKSPKRDRLSVINGPVELTRHLVWSGPAKWNIGATDAVPACRQIALRDHSRSRTDRKLAFDSNIAGIEKKVGNSGQAFVSFAQARTSDGRPLQWRETIHVLVRVDNLRSVFGVSRHKHRHVLRRGLAKKIDTRR